MITQHQLSALDYPQPAIIIHQCNTLGFMGRGIALAVKQRYPHVYSAYKRMCDQTTNKKHLLGMCQFVHAGNGHIIANAFAQATIQRPNQPKTKHTSDDALISCIRTAMLHASLHQLPLVIPDGIGCVNGGGDWHTVYAAIVALTNEFPHTPIHLCRYA